MRSVIPITMTKLFHQMSSWSEKPICQCNTDLWRDNCSKLTTLDPIYNFPIVQWRNDFSSEQHGTWHCHFYLCGGKTSIAHFLSWSRQVDFYLKWSILWHSGSSVFHSNHPDNFEVICHSYCLPNQLGGHCYSSLLWDFCKLFSDAWVGSCFCNIIL